MVSAVVNDFGSKPPVDLRVNLVEDKIKDAIDHGDLDAVISILDGMGDNALAKLDPGLMSLVFAELVGYSYFQPDAVNSVLGAIMDAFGETLDPDALVYQLYTLAEVKNYDGLTIVLNHLMEDQVAAILAVTSPAAGSFGQLYMGFTMMLLAEFASNGIGVDDNANEVLDNFMDVFGKYLVVDQVEQALETTLSSANYDGMAAILDNLSEYQIDHFSPNLLSDLKQAHIALGSNANDVMTAGFGETVLFGLAGNDILIAYESVAGVPNSHLYGGDGDDILVGMSGNDVLNGGDGGDIMVGGAGNDILYGGDGGDLMIGDAGADTFVFKAGDTGVDIVQGFAIAEGDKLDFSDLLEGYDPQQDSITDFLTATQTDNGIVFSIDLDGAGDKYESVEFLNLDDFVQSAGQGELSAETLQALIDSGVIII